MKRGADEVIVKGEKMKGLRWLLSCDEADFVGCTGTSKTFKESKEDHLKELKERKEVSSKPIHQHEILKSSEE